MKYVSIENDIERVKLCDLLDEFGSKILVRNVGPQHEYCHRGIIDVIEDKDTGMVFYGLNIPDDYAEFIDYLLEKDRNR